MKRTIHHIVLSASFWLMLLSGNYLQGQEVVAWSKIDSSSIMIGQQVNMELGINIPEEYQVSWPLIGDTLSANIEVLKQGKIDTIKKNGVLRLIQQLTLTSFDSGYFAIPSQDFRFANTRDTAARITSTGALYLQVFVPDVDTSQAIKPIVGPMAEPYTFAELLPWILLGLLVIVLIVLLILYLKKRGQKQPMFERRQQPKLPPHVLAINKLEELRLAKVWQSGKLKQYHSQLTDIIREYLDNRYHFDAPEMTSDEILEVLKNEQVNKEALAKISGVFFLSDMVKFAKAQPTALENDLSLSHCVDFVNETKADMAVTSENGEKTN
jgi:hypothetical protein